jgi:hypothetical protein
LVVVKTIEIQIIGLLFGVFMLYLSFLYYKRKEFGKGDLVTWIFIWAAFIFAALFPANLVFILQPLKVSRVMDLLTIGAFMLLSVFVFINYKVNRKNENRLKEIVMKLALNAKELKRK